MLFIVLTALLSMLKIYDVYPPTVGEKFSICGKFGHGSTVTELPNGNIFAVWYAGLAEKHPDVGIWTATLDHKTEKWTEARLLEKAGPTKSEGNPVVYYDDETKRLWNFWSTMDRAGYDRIPGGWSTCKLRCSHSEDLGKTWAPPRYLTKFWGRMTRNKPLRLSNGDVILPIYSEWMGYKGNFLIATREEFAKGSQTSKWKKIGPVRGGIMQPTVVELELGHLFAHFRTSKSCKFAPWVSEAESFDFGRHWTPIRKGDLYNPNAGCDMVKLKNGHLALAFNDSPEGRCPLSIAISEDNGKTWPFINNLETDNTNGARYGYPGLIQAVDGSMYCSYTNKYGINIRCAHFDEDWVKNK
jgi:predicted neuraminidase